MTTPNLPEAHIIESVAEAWGVALQPAGCEQCGQAYLVSAERTGGRCPNCARGALAPQPARLRPEPPELLAPFQKSRAELLPRLTQFVKEVWLRPDDLDAAKLAQRLLPVYWPMWLVDSDVSGHWQGEVGFDYQVKSSQESYSASGWHSREVMETRVRWEPRVGQMRRHYDNVAVPAASDHTALQTRLGPFQLEQAKAYDAAQLQHAAIRVPDGLPENAWPLARTQLDQRAIADCVTAAQGQHSRNFTVQADYDSLHWTQLLLPLYVTFYTDDNGQAHPIFIHGQTGQVSGVRMASQKKGWQWAGGLAALAAVVFIIGLVLGLIGMAVPPLVALGGVCLIGAFPLGLLALIPALWPIQWNGKQEKPRMNTDKHR